MPWFPDVHTDMGLAGGHANALGRPEKVVLSVGMVANESLDLTYVGPSLAPGRHRGVGSTSLEHLGPITALLSLQRSAGSSSPEAGEGKEVFRT